MRKTVLLLASMTVALMMACGVAFAATIEGTEGRDVLEGTNEADQIYGRAGNDTLRAFRGYDLLFGNDGNDNLRGNRGNDRISGGPGDDDLMGQEDQDTLNGGPGNDQYRMDRGSWGDDTITADDSGTDTLLFLDFFNSYFGGVVVDLVPSDTGNEARRLESTLNFPTTVEIEDVWGTGNSDIIRGNSADNFFYAAEGDDDLRGRGGNDTMVGDSDRDVIYGGPGGDTIEGGYSEDTIYGGSDEDTIYGDHSPNSPFPDDPDDDTIDVADGDSGDTVDCGPGTDTVYVDATIPPGGDTSVAIDNIANCETVNAEVQNAQP